MKAFLKFLKRFDTYVIPIVALVISLISLVIAWPQDAQLNLMKPSHFLLWHQADGERNLQIIVPCVIENTGKKNQSILRVAAILQNQKNPDDSHLLQWREFWEYTDNNWSSNSLVHQLSVEPYSSITRNIMFEGSSTWLPERGQYKLKIITILNDEGQKTEEVPVEFSANQQTEIRRHFEEGKGNATLVDTLSSDWKSRTLNAEEARKLMERK